jgi:hypothetical protein
MDTPDADKVVLAFFDGHRVMTAAAVDGALRLHIARLKALHQHKQAIYVRVYSQGSNPALEVLGTLHELEDRARQQALRYRDTRQFLLQAGDMTELHIMADESGSNVHVTFGLEQNKPVQYTMCFNPCIEGPTLRTFGLAYGKDFRATCLVPQAEHGTLPRTTVVGQLLTVAQRVNPEFDDRALLEAMYRGECEPTDRTRLNDLARLGLLEDAEDEDEEQQHDASDVSDVDNTWENYF